MARWSLARRRSRAEWEGLVERHRTSGLSVREFCGIEGLNVGTYKWWKRQLRAAGRSTSSRKSSEVVRPEFVPVTVRDGEMAAADAGAVEVLIQGDERRVRIRADCPVALAVAVTEALQGIKSCS